MIFNKKYTPRNEELKRMFSKFRAENKYLQDVLPNFQHIKKNKAYRDLLE